jgi:hypothetical protein
VLPSPDATVKLPLLLVDLLPLSPLLSLTPTTPTIVVIVAILAHLVIAAQIFSIACHLPILKQLATINCHSSSTSVAISQSHSQAPTATGQCPHIVPPFIPNTPTTTAINVIIAILTHLVIAAQIFSIAWHLSILKRLAAINCHSSSACVAISIGHSQAPTTTG